MTAVSFFETSKPRVFGHRGAAGEAPENTVVSFARAVECGVDIMELDVHATRDGAVVVLHDDTLERTTDASGPVKERSWLELQAADAGFRFTTDGRSYPYRGRGVRIPSLDDLFSLFPEMRFNIEVKQASPPIIERVLQLVEKHGNARRVLLAAEKDETMQQIRAYAGGRVATSFAAGEVVEFIDRARDRRWDGYEPQGFALQIPVSFAGIELVTVQNVEAAHRLGLEVHVWTINDRAEMDRLLALGVDGIMSDLPALARAAADAFSRSS